MKTLQFIAVLLTAIALMPAGAHLFALPNKITLAPNEYFIVQGIYRGWALFGVVLFANLIALAALAFIERAHRKPFILVLISLGCQFLVLVLFFAFIYPANQATNNWTEIPAGWETLRRQWEYGHAVNAAISFAGFCALVWSVLLARN